MELHELFRKILDESLDLEQKHRLLELKRRKIVDQDTVDMVSYKEWEQEFIQFQRILRKSNN